MLTIIIPTIGRANSFLRSLRSACVIDRSVVKQIIVIDNSQSRNITELDLNSSFDDRIHLVTYKERKPMGESWNGAIRHVSQPWLLYLHDDDELIADNINTLSPILLSNSEASFIAFDYFDRSLKKTVLKSRSHPKSMNSTNSIIRNPPKFVSTIISLKALKSIGSWDDSYGYFLDLVGFIEMTKVTPPAFIPQTIGVHTVGALGQASAVHKRATGYGDYIPITINKLFPMFNDSERGTLLESLSIFVYPPTSLSFRCRIFRLLKAIKRF